MSFKHTTPTFKSDITVAQKDANGDILKDTQGKTIYSVIGTTTSKYLQDSSGKYIIDPTSPTGEPYIIPVDMNFDQMVVNLTDKYNTNIGTAPIDSTKILYDFKTSGSNDLQRSDTNGEIYKTYTQLDGSIDNGFVSDYTSAASLYFGAVSAGLKLTLNQTEMGGGALNYWNSLQNSALNTSGNYYNNPKNVDNMTAGYHYYQNNISNNETVDARVNAIDVFHTLVHDTFGKIGDFYIGTPVQKVFQVIYPEISTAKRIALEAYGFIVKEAKDVVDAIYQDTTVITLTPNSSGTNLKYESYDTTGTKTSSTVSAYNASGELLGRSTSSHATGDFIAVPNANSSASVIETLQQTTANSIGSATKALDVAAMVGLDKNNMQRNVA